MSSRKTRILIVDDEESLTRMMALTLEQTGAYETRHVNHADQTLAAAHEFEPDVVVLDVIMPEMDGGEVLAQLRADPLTRDMPVIFMTALVDSEEAPLGGLVSAGHHFLPKPISCAELARCIESVQCERSMAATPD